MDAGIYIGVYLVLKSSNQTAIYYLPSEHQSPDLFIPRTPLGPQAKNPGWQGFLYDLAHLKASDMPRVG